MSTTVPTADDFLTGGAGGKSAAFERVGDTVTGRIARAPETRQQTKLDGSLDYWDNGEPKWQLVVALQTEARDDNDDDGIRSLYIKGSRKPGSRSLHDAVRQAVVASGAKGLEVGGTLTVTFVGEEPSQTRGFNPRKLYEATYSPPTGLAASGDFLGTASAPATPPPAPQVPAAPQGNGQANDPVATARSLIAAGVPDDIIASTTGLGAAAVAALRNVA